MIPTDWLRHRARNGPDRLAVRDRTGAALTYAELLRHADTVAAGLDGDLGLHVVELGAGLEHTIEINAAMLAGVPFQTLRPRLPEDERRAALSGSKPVGDGSVVCGADREPAAAARKQGPGRRAARR